MLKSHSLFCLSGNFFTLKRGFYGWYNKKASIGQRGRESSGIGGEKI